MRWAGQHLVFSPARVDERAAASLHGSTGLPCAAAAAGQQLLWSSPPSVHAGAEAACSNQRATHGLQDSRDGDSDQDHLGCRAACKAAGQLMGEAAEARDAAAVPGHCCRLWEKDPQLLKHKRLPHKRP